MVALAGLYYAAAKTGYLLEFAGPVAAIVWLPVGVGIAFLYLGGLRYWPGVLIGDLLANDYTALPIGSALGQTCGNMLEVILAVLLLRRLVRAWLAARQRSRRRRDRRGDRGGGDGQRHRWLRSRSSPAKSSTGTRCRPSGARGGSAIRPAR